MRNSQVKKDENRLRILDAAGQLFRQRGIEAVTVAEIMSAAGMTHGGFYRHFSDKSDLVTQSMAHVLKPPPEQGEIDLAAFLDSYLTMSHRAEVGNGCAFAALGPELARNSAATRHSLTATIRKQLHGFSQSLEGPENARRDEAVGKWAAMIGALLLARVVDDDALAEQILNGARNWIEADRQQTI